MDIEKILKTAAVLLITICLILSSSAMPARADSEGAGTVTATELNFRDEPSTDGSILTTISQGSVVLVTDTAAGGDWYKITYNGQTGYVKAEFITFSETADADFGTGTVTGDGVRIRTGPDTDSDILGYTDSGDSLKVIGVSDDWYKVSYEGSDGYIKSTFLSLGDESTARSGKTADTNDKENTADTVTASASHANDTAETTDTADTGNGEETQTVTVTSASGTGTVNATYVRVRTGPSTSHDILDTLDPGTEMAVTGDAGDWYRVAYNGDEGYVYKIYLTVSDTAEDTASYVSPAEDVSSVDDTTAWVISAVHMRTGPDTSYTSQRVLDSGTSVTITGSTEKWYRVEYNGDEGYIFRTYLTTDDPAVTRANATSEGERIVAEAKNYLGVPYVYGGSSPSGFDCSGFVQYVFRQCGYSITRTAVTQSYDGYAVSRSELQPGDIIIFGNSANSGIGHSGIYIGNGQFIHASSGGGRVMISELSQNYYNVRFYGARRIV